MQPIPKLSNTEIKNLPDGNPDIKINLGNAIQFSLDNISDPDKEYVEMITTGIWHGLFIYLGNGAIQLTKIGYLYLETYKNPNPTEN